MPTFQNFLANVYWNNTGQELIIAAAVFIGLFVIFKLFDSSVVVYLRQRAKKTKTQWDDLIIDFISAIHWQFYAFLALFFSSRTLTLPELADKVIGVLLMVFVAFYVVQGLSRVVDQMTKKQLEKRGEEGLTKNTSMIKAFGILFKIIIYSIAILMILTNLGIEITPLIASMGIGGIAIAIALQGVLTDLFSAFSIYFDKPFKEGDYIKIGNDSGTVKYIGIKTTRIQTLQGEELIVSNSELTSSRVRNFKKMKRRRIAFKFGVEYGTPQVKMKKINGIVKNIIDSVEKTTFDRVHFNEFGDFSLNFDVVYYVESPVYSDYMDAHQEINFKLKEAFEKEKIIFAFPTQTLFVKKD